MGLQSAEGKRAGRKMAGHEKWWRWRRDPAGKGLQGRRWCSAEGQIKGQ